MEVFSKLFDSLLVFVYHCFDRIVIHGYLGGLSRPEPVVHGPFRPSGPGHPSGEQGGAQPARRRLPPLGGGLRSQFTKSPSRPQLLVLNNSRSNIR